MEFNNTCLEQQRMRVQEQNNQIISNIVREAKRTAGQQAVATALMGEEEEVDYMTDEAMAHQMIS